MNFILPIATAVSTAQTPATTARNRRLALALAVVAAGFFVLGLLVVQ